MTVRTQTMIDFRMIDFKMIDFKMIDFKMIFYLHMIQSNSIS